jgi:hypothetical protein
VIVRDFNLLISDCARTHLTSFQKAASLDRVKDLSRGKPAMRTMAAESGLMITISEVPYRETKELKVESRRYALPNRASVCLALALLKAFHGFAIATER